MVGCTRVTSTLCGWAPFFLYFRYAITRFFMPRLTLPQAAHLLAQAFASAPAGLQAMRAAARRLVQAEDALFTGLSKDVLRRFGTQLPYVAHAELVDFLLNHRALGAAFLLRDAFEFAQPADPDAPPAVKLPPPSRLSFLPAHTVKHPANWAITANDTGFNLPKIDAVGDLCALLEIHPQRLEAFSTRWREGDTHEANFDHYFSYWAPKKSGGARLIEQPKSDLKAAQRLLLQRLLNKVDSHEAAHGFRRGHSIVTHARLHTGQALVLRCDLQDFFTSIPASRVHGIFRQLGYAEPVAQSLTRICTTRPTRAIAKAGRVAGADWNAVKRLQSDHLPQGAPTSPALANLAAFRLDLRLNALAEGCGAVYSRYADDLAFSGAADCGIGGERFYLRVCAIALEEKFVVNIRKTKLMHQGARQEITGLVVNQKPNIARDEFDTLKAILTNACNTGLAAQNRASVENFAWHLQGRISFVLQVNPARGRKLLMLWNRLAAVNKMP